ncbi:MAG: ACT domain-containing protein, partial [Varibaculum cambriense]|nr:ACT domain-containing protein [Varibaculum cambriense]
MKAIMTVTGIDHTGIIAAVSQALAQNQVNITNVSQTLMDEYFTMIMQLEFDENQIG